MPETHLDKFKKLLAELFMFDQADLDFGIYRIMNAKRDEITRFLDRDLLPQVREALGELEQGDRAAVEAELAKAIEQAKALGADAESLPKVKELRQKLAQKADVEALESEVFSDLYSFFRRYYNEGDFLSLRRYKEGVYAIPYEGEEVKLHWANADQYYIKTTEYFRDYTFKLPDGRRVHFKLSEADTEQNNNKPANGQERRFILRADRPVSEESRELVAYFDYQPDPEKRKQSDLNSLAVQGILGASEVRDWLVELAIKSPTENNPERTLLDKRLSDYTARNTFDYFIHKDLGGFLKRELDFYIKNEVMELDDIESEPAPRVEQYLAKVKAIRHIAHKIIEFLTQIETFQKKMWLKKKFIVGTSYCITINCIPVEFYPEIVANQAQREEWVHLLGIDKFGGDLTVPGYSVPISVEFLKAHPTLALDTRNFADEFTDRLLNAIGDLNEHCDGLLIQSENFQSLLALGRGYKANIDVVYIDPPYNTDASAILYKNDYKDSSWLTLIDNRLALAENLMSSTGVICFAIDDEEVAVGRQLLRHRFIKELGVAVVRSNPQSRKTKGKFSPIHEYALFYGKSVNSAPGSLEMTDKRLARYPKEDENGRYAWMNLIRTGSNDQRSDRPKLYYPIFVDDKDKIRVPEMTWSEETREYIVHEAAKENESAVYPVAETEGGTIEKNWHRGHPRIASEPGEYRVRRDSTGSISIDFKTRMDEDSMPGTWWDKNEYASANYGASELKELFGFKPFEFPKALSLVVDCLKAANARQDSVVLDYFGGSGTTGHAVIELNREDGGRRKFVLVEMGNYFETVLLPRIKKVTFSPEWKDGKPERLATQEQAQRSPRVIKVIRLESYEDALNNLEMKRTQAQGELLEHNPAMREDYVLHYMLDIESKNSASLLDLDQFENPFGYKLKVGTGSAGETRLANVDLVETFNWLLGLRVKHVDTIRGFRVVQGVNPAGEKSLIIWRSTREKSNADLDDFFLKQGYNTRDMEFDLIYANGDNNLENLKRPDETWKVRLIEDEFKRLMFDVEDV